MDEKGLKNICVLKALLNEYLSKVFFLFPDLWPK